MPTSGSHQAQGPKNDVHAAPLPTGGGSIIHKDQWRSKHWKLLGQFLTLAGGSSDVLLRCCCSSSSTVGPPVKVPAEVEELSAHDRTVVLQLMQHVAIHPPDLCTDSAGEDEDSIQREEGFTARHLNNSACRAVLRSISAFVASELSPLEVQLLRLLGKQCRKTIAAADRGEFAQAVLTQIAEMASGACVGEVRDVTKDHHHTAAVAAAAVVARPPTTGVAQHSPSSVPQPNTRQQHAQQSPLAAPQWRSMLDVVTTTQQKQQPTSSSLPLPQRRDELLFSRPCDRCDDSTGDIFECAECKAWLHEMCGGVHPDHPVCVCRECRRLMGLESDRSELNSETSSDERVTTETDDSSLSGFIVRTEDEEDEEDDETSSNSSAASSRVSSADSLDDLLMQRRRLREQRLEQRSKPSASAPAASNKSRAKRARSPPTAAAPARSCPTRRTVAAVGSAPERHTRSGGGGGGGAAVERKLHPHHVSRKKESSNRVK